MYFACTRSRNCEVPGFFVMILHEQAMNMIHAT